MISHYFKTEELVSQKVFKLLGDESIKLFYPEFLETVLSIRTILGLKMICNNYSKGLLYRGYREIGCGVGVSNGAHYKGLAGDFDFYYDDFKPVNSQLAITKILGIRKQLPFLAALETDVGWVHIDCMTEKYSEKRLGIKNGKILLFSVKTGRSKIV